MKYTNLKSLSQLKEEGVLPSDASSKDIPKQYKEKIYESADSVEKEREFENDMLKAIVELSKKIEIWSDNHSKWSDKEKIRFRWQMGKIIIDFYEKYNIGYVKCPNCGLYQNKVENQNNSIDGYGQGSKIRKNCKMCNEEMDIQGKTYHDMSKLANRMENIKDDSIPTPDLSDKAREYIQENSRKSNTIKKFQLLANLFPKSKDIEYYNWKLCLLGIVEQISLHPEYVREKYFSMFENDQIVDNYIIPQEFTREEDRYRTYFRDAGKKLNREFREHYMETYTMKTDTIDNNEWNTDKRALKEEDFEEYQNQKGE